MPPAALLLELGEDQMGAVAAIGELDDADAGGGRASTRRIAVVGSGLKNSGITPLRSVTTRVSSRLNRAIGVASLSDGVHMSGQGSIWCTPC